MALYKVLGRLWAPGMKVPLSFGATGSSGLGRSKGPQFSVLDSMFTGNPLEDVHGHGLMRPGAGKRGRPQQLSDTWGSNGVSGRGNMNLTTMPSAHNPAWAHSSCSMRLGPP